MEISAEEMAQGLENLLDAFKTLQSRLEYARGHIKDHLGAFTPQELQCLAMDGIIAYADIPEDKRTEHAKFMMEKKNV